MASNKKIELVSSQDSPTGVSGQNVNGVFIPNPPKPVSPVKALTPEAISEPATPMTVTPPEPTTGSIGMLGSIMEGTDQFTQNLEQQRTSAEANKKTALDAYINSLGTPGKEEMTADLYAQNDGVDEIQTELNDINDQLRKEARGLDLRLRELDRNAQGLFGGALEQAKQEATDESLQRQADLSIIQMGIQGRYDSAKAIADRYIAVKMERDLAKQDALKTIYEDNKDTFTTAEQREFETKQADRERALKKTEDDLKMISDLSLNALSNGAPSSVVTQMRQAKTIEEAISIGGRYVDSQERLLKQLQIENLQSQINERETPTGQKLTASQYAALGFGERVVSASSIIDEIGVKFTGAGSILGQFLPNSLKTADRQRYEQAQRNFITAVLRRESGAAISPTEFDSAEQQYFPQPGDSAEVLIQKKQNRDMVAASLLREAGQDASIQELSITDPLGIGVTAEALNPLRI